MKDLKKIQLTLTDLNNLLNVYDAQGWGKYFVNVLKDSHSIDNDDELKEWVRRITNVYRAMGSFSDLVLCVNKKWPKRENERLCVLRDQLLSEAMDLIESKQNNQSFCETLYRPQKKK